MKSRTRKLLTSLIILIACHSQSHASETDAFTFRYTPIADSEAVIDSEVNHRIEHVLKHMQRKGCDEKVLFEKLGEQFRFPIYGKLEGWVMRHPHKVPHVQERVQDSIYKKITFGEAYPIYLGKMGFGPVLRVNGQLIGNDKLGHFMDEGYHYFELVVRQKKSIQEALQYGIDTENGIYGIKQTGVHSYADTVANFHGMNFWARIVGKPIWGSGDTYIQCENGKYVQKVRFTLADYVDGAWDEGINCNDYRDDSYRDRVLGEIVKLEVRDQRPYSCPVAPAVCGELAAKYGEFGEKLLHPLCYAFKNKNLTEN